MLVEIAIGDAYGAGFEFSAVEKVKKFNNLTAYNTHDLGLPAGNYTDDTQMSLALAELLIKGDEWNAANIAQKFVECYKRDVRLGYAMGFQLFLDSIETGADFRKKIRPNSARNGAAMRSAPIGYISDISLLMTMSEVQAVLTHDTEAGVKSSQAVALAAHYFIYNVGPKSGLTEFVSDYTNYCWRDDWSQPVACCGIETANALLTVLKNSTSLKDILIKSVDYSGDVDTVAALGYGIASVSNEYSRNLPEFLYEDLENGPFGRDYLQSVDKKLCQLKTIV